MGIIDILMNIFDLIFEPQQYFGSKTQHGPIAGRRTFLKSGCVLVGAVIILWASVVMYFGFYYACMPSIDHLKPVHMQFQ